MDPNNPNKPYFNPFMNCYRPQLDPNNSNPNQFVTFSNWYPQPPFFNQNSPAGDNVSENQPNPDVDVVPETQPYAQLASSRLTNFETDEDVIVRKVHEHSIRLTGQCFVNLNESDDEVEMDMPPPTSPQRPPSRNDKGKRLQASSSTDYKETLETISDSLQKFVSLQEEKQYNNDMKFLWTLINHLTVRAREIAEKTKERIMKKYNLD
ncbi:hypothetical protein R6Q57_013850 [Mikania cordata]